MPARSVTESVVRLLLSFLVSPAITLAATAFVVGRANRRLTLLVGAGVYLLALVVFVGSAILAVEMGG